jgi:hypothetical protein
LSSLYLNRFVVIKLKKTCQSQLKSTQIDSNRLKSTQKSIDDIPSKKNRGKKNLFGVDFFNYLRTVLNNNQTNGLKPWFFKNVSKIHQKTVMKTVEKSWLNNQSVCQKKQQEDDKRKQKICDLCLVAIQLSFSLIRNR